MRTVETSDEQIQELRAMGAKNWELPPLEPAPCVRFKSTGEVHVWSPFFARRPDLCDCCDENGNTDPAFWRGRYSESKSVVTSKMEVATPAQTVPTPKGLHFNMHEFDTPAMQGVTPAVGLASSMWGVSENYSKDYTATYVGGTSMPANMEAAANTPVKAALQDYLSKQINV